MHQVIGIQTLTLAWSKDWALLATAGNPWKKMSKQSLMDREVPGEKFQNIKGAKKYKFGHTEEDKRNRLTLYTSPLPQGNAA